MGDSLTRIRRILDPRFRKVPGIRTWEEGPVGGLLTPIFIAFGAGVSAGLHVELPMTVVMSGLGILFLLTMAFQRLVPGTSRWPLLVGFVLCTQP